MECEKKKKKKERKGRQKHVWRKDGEILVTCERQKGDVTVKST